MPQRLFGKGEVMPSCKTMAVADLCQISLNCIRDRVQSRSA